MSEISVEICYQTRLVYICASKLLDACSAGHNFFSMKALAVAQHH